MNIVGGSSFGHHPFEKGKKKNKKMVQSARASKPVQTKKFKADQSPTECFYYKRMHH